MMGEEKHHSWEEAQESFGLEADRAIVLGAVDTGKTTFSLELVKRRTEDGRKTALIDCDVGQSTLGPPCTVGAKVFASSAEVGPDLSPPFLWFVGSPTPENRIIQSVIGAYEARRWVGAQDASDIIMDTTGLVGGDKARRLKAAKIDTMLPAVVFGLQREEELEHLLRPIEARGISVIRVRCPDAVVRRSPDQRRAYRRKQFEQYLAGAAILQMDLGSAALYECPANFASFFPSQNVVTQQVAVAGDGMKGLVVGLGSQIAHTLALGLVVDLDPSRNKIVVAAPRVKQEDIEFIEFGCVFVEDIPEFAA